MSFFLAADTWPKIMRGTVGINIITLKDHLIQSEGRKKSRLSDE